MIRTRFSAMLLVLLVVVFFTCASVASTNVMVMTYNVDEGTDFTAITAVLTKTNPPATATDFENAVADTITEVQNSNPVLRAQLIATEIANANPDLVGLQEAAVWTAPNLNLDLNLLDLILFYLAQQGHPYQAVVTVEEFHIGITLPNLGPVSFTDQDVILASTDFVNAIADRQQGHYNHVVPLPAFPPYLPTTTNITRGWAYVDATKNGTAFRFITTHLEDGTNSTSPIFALVQALQAVQLVGGPASTALPVIIAGDFNTIANDPFSPTFLTYSFMLGKGLTDAWRRTHPFLVFGGATCCQDDLTISQSELRQRLDQVFIRNHVSVVPGETHLVDQFDALDSSWPSDHAAVESELQVGP